MHDKDHYRIQREYEQDDAVFKSLSEGEKTIISFLYFVELCRGKENQDETKQKIIVIDDPISSLSHIYIFNVAQLIREYFINGNQTEFLQCFVLTHSLYFFHELVRVSKGKYLKLFRVTKQTTSKIEEMEHNEIQNEYEVYWHIVNTASQENMPLAANAMRNIIEHFFGFIEQANSINNIFQKPAFKDNQFQSFQRYMNRESHTDRSNISDYKEFDLEIFQQAFEKVFEEAGYHEHYEKYMGSN